MAHKLDPSDRRSVLSPCCKLGPVTPTGPTQELYVLSLFHSAFIKQQTAYDCQSPVIDRQGKISNMFHREAPEVPFFHGNRDSGGVFYVL